MATSRARGVRGVLRWNLSILASWHLGGLEVEERLELVIRPLDRSRSSMAESGRPSAAGHPG